MIHAGKAIGILDLIKNINENTKHIQSREVTIYIDSKKVLSEYSKQIKRESEATAEAAGIITEIKMRLTKLLLIYL